MHKDIAESLTQNHSLYGVEEFTLQMDSDTDAELKYFHWSVPTNTTVDERLE